MLRSTLVLLNGKNCIIRHEFRNNCSKSQFHENVDENYIYV